MKILKLSTVLLIIVCILLTIEVVLLESQVNGLKNRLTVHIQAQHETNQYFHKMLQKLSDTQVHDEVSLRMYKNTH